MGGVTLPKEIVDEWRRAAFRPEESIRPVPPRREGSLKIVALMSCPRLVWSDTFGCVNETFLPLGIPVVRHSSVFWGQGLTRLLEEAVSLEMDYAITVDYDSVFSKEDVVRLIKLMHDSNADAIVPVQVRRESNSSMFTMRDDQGKLLHVVDRSEFEKDLTPIATGHFGLTILRVTSFKRLAKPWFLAIPDEDGQWRAGHIDEDIYFWLNAELAKWKVYLANEVRIGHLQNVVSWPRADFTPQFQYVNDFTQKGKP
jgi:hypothetical protein